MLDVRPFARALRAKSLTFTRDFPTVDAEYLAAFELIVMPIAREFAPELVLVSAGFDSAKGDRVGGMALSAAGYAAMTAQLCSLANGKVVMALEGGYKPSLAAKGVQACVRALLDDPAVHRADHGGDSVVDAGAGSFSNLPQCAQETMLEVIKAHARYWPELKHSAERLVGGHISHRLEEKLHLDDGIANQRRERTSGPQRAQHQSDLAGVSGEGSQTHTEGHGALQQCRQCQKWLSKLHYSQSQLKKKRVGARMCKVCCGEDDLLDVVL
uniref:histone deacetylase n=1 Tax=Chrysotila carterae TaxID=13221 RepID=A0A6S9V8E7_CHRCT